MAQLEFQTGSDRQTGRNKIFGGVTRQGALACCLTILVGAALLWPLPNDYRAPWVASLMDLLHVPLFAVVTVCLFWLLGYRLVAACGFAVLLAGAGEFAQRFVDRSVSVPDFLRGVLGVLLAAVVLKAGWRHPMRQVAAGLIVAIAVAWGACQYGPVFADAIQAFRTFPVLADFSSPWAASRWRLESARITSVATNPPDSSRSATIEFLPNGHGSSGLVLLPVVRDWSAYRTMHCQIEFRGEPIDLGVSIRDGRKVAAPRKRFDWRNRLSAGSHDICLDLVDIAEGRDCAPVDLTRVQSLHLWVENLRKPTVLLLHRVYLDGSRGAEGSALFPVASSEKR